MEAKILTLTHYVGGKLVGDTADFNLPLSINYPEFTTFINFETFREFILVSGVWEIMLTGDPPTTTFIDFTTGASSAAIEAGTNTRAGNLVLGGNAAIGSTLKFLQFDLQKSGLPTGTASFTVRDTLDDIVAFVNFDVATLSTSRELVQKELDVLRILESGDRILFEFTGGNGSNRVLQFFDGTGGLAGWSETRYDGTYTNDNTDIINLVADSNPEA